ncbi:TetR family transcriptional regulator [Alteromonas sp. NFXS44]|uniref:TetR/AcrR family transcriptional regulator n=1 Tax=Alteromonas sp. NFXS44 TaxID=2818435 RepID=UPI0032DE3F57
MAGTIRKTNSANTTKNTTRTTTSTTKRRGKGRPVGGQLEIGRDILIETTCKLLSELPPKNVTRVKVAEEVGVDPSLIRYYFKNRSALLLAAFERLTSEYNSMLKKEKSNFDSSPEGQLRSRVSALFRLISTYPHYHRLIIEEIAPMDTPESRKALQELTGNRLVTYGKIIQDGVEANEFRQVDTGLLFIAIIGMANFFTSGEEVVKIALNKDSLDEEAASDYQSFICDMLLNGLKVRPE